MDPVSAKAVVDYLRLGGIPTPKNRAEQHQMVMQKREFVEASGTDNVTVIVHWNKPTDSGTKYLAEMFDIDNQEHWQTAEERFNRNKK